MTATTLWPTEIRLDREKRVLTVTYDDGASAAFDAEYLRVFSPSAEVQGHSPQQRRLIAGKSRVRVMAIQPVGNYAVRLAFDDGHNTGIFTWDYFDKLARERETLWAGYLSELAQKGLGR
ncbi:MAG: gamma-butyrobetaine hydroxylase-like domain-containing protein [Bauldia sp.]